MNGRIPYRGVAHISNCAARYKLSSQKYFMHFFQLVGVESCNRQYSAFAYDCILRFQKASHSSGLLPLKTWPLFLRWWKLKVFWLLLIATSVVSAVRHEGGV